MKQSNIALIFFMPNNLWTISGAVSLRVSCVILCIQIDVRVNYPFSVWSRLSGPYLITCGVIRFAIATKFLCFVYSLALYFLFIKTFDCNQIPMLCVLFVGTFFYKQSLWWCNHLCVQVSHALFQRYLTWKFDVSR